MTIDVGRPLRWVIVRLGARTLLLLGLLLLVLLVASAVLVSEVRGLDLGLAWTAIALGMLAGWLLAVTRLPDWAAGVVLLALGVAGVLWWVGGLERQVMALLSAATGLAGDLLREAPVPRWSEVELAVAGLSEGLGTLYFRVRDWSSAILIGEPTLDPVATALVWSLALWLIGAWAGWLVRRHHRALLAVFPAGTVLALTLFYTGTDTTTLLVLLGATLLLLALSWYDVRLRRWKERGVDAADLSGEIAVAVVGITVALVVAAAVAPSISLDDIVEFIEDMGAGEDDAGESVGSAGRVSEPGQDRGPLFGDAERAALPRQHLLGSGPELSERVVMTIATGDLPPMPQQAAVDQSVPRYYWRSMTFDRYVRSGWLSSGTWVDEYEAGASISSTTLPFHRPVQQQMQIVGDARGLLFSAGVLVSADHDYSVAWRADGDLLGAVIEANEYHVDVLVPAVSGEQLRLAGSDYPGWIESRYLDLPDSIPSRVLRLGRDLTATAPTPFDRAIAIRNYLRTFDYTLDLSQPPSNRDVVDYFLFDLQKGYCDYYATAMVVLARASGVPARLAIGYASGAYDSAEAHYVVTEADAHAWVQVYFPGYGWIDFEPTAGLPLVDWDGGYQDPAWETGEEARRTGPAWWNPSSWPWWWLLAGPVGLAVLAASGWSALDTWRLRRMKPAAAVATLYGRLRRRALGAGVALQPGDTPYEFLALLSAWVTRLPPGSPWSRMLTPAIHETRRIVEFHVQASYTRKPVNPFDQALAMEAWLKLRRRLLAARFLNPFPGG